MDSHWKQEYPPEKNAWGVASTQQILGRNCVRGVGVPSLHLGRLGVQAESRAFAVKGSEKKSKESR